MRVLLRGLLLLAILDTLLSSSLSGAIGFNVQPLEECDEVIQVIGDDGVVRTVCVEDGKGGNPITPGPGPAPEVPIPEEPKYREWLTYLCFEGDAETPGCLSGSRCDRTKGSLLAQLWRQDIDPPSAPYQVGTPFCTGPGTPQPEPEEGTPTITIEDVMKFDIKPSPINIEPSPNTLIRFETNFYTSDATQNFQMTVGGQKFDVNVYPIEYSWTYGDGESNTIGSNGAPLRPGEEADRKTPYTHAYQETGTYQVGLTTKFIADYSKNGGPRQAILGTGEVVTPAQTIDVWRTEIRNVDEACAENPDSWGCPDAKTP